MMTCHSSTTATATAVRSWHGAFSGRLVNYQASVRHIMRASIRGVCVLAQVCMQRASQ